MAPTEAGRLSGPFQRLAWSNLAAQFAEQIGLAAAPLVAVLVFAADAGETGLLQTAQTLPFLLLSLPAGVLADRVSRRGMMTVAEALRAISLLCVLLLYLSGLLSLPLLAVLGFLGATGTVVYSVSASSLVPALVPRAWLSRANGRLELARSSALAAGPSVAGVVVGGVGAPAAYVFAVMLSTIAVILLAGLPEPERPVQTKRHVLHDLREGAGFVLAHPLLRPMFLTAVIFNIAWFVLQAIYVVYAVRELGLSAAGVGTTLSIYGLGMVAGALITPRLSTGLPFGRLLVLGPLSGVLGSLVMVLTMRMHSGLLAGIAFFLFGVGPIIWTIASTTLRQAIAPAHLLGRVSALMMISSFGARPVGAAIGAFIGARYGSAACIMAAAVGFLAQFAVISLSPVWRLNALPAAPAAS